MSDYAKDIAKALCTPGGHLSIGRGGFCLHYENGRLSGYDCDLIKQQAIEVGLPVIDSRGVPFEIAARLAIAGPMIAVNRAVSPDFWHVFSEAPLATVAAGYRQVGADVHNIEDDPASTAWFAERALALLDQLLDDWLAHILQSAVTESLTSE